MARYVTTQPTTWSPDTAFDWMADLRHLSLWDPSIEDSQQVEGDGPAVGAEYDVTVRAAGGSRTMRYRIVDLDRAARTLTAESRTAVLRSDDRIRVDPTSTGAEVTYDADLVLHTPLKPFDPVLKVAFDRMGDKAADGLRRALAEPRPPS